MHVRTLQHRALEVAAACRCVMHGLHPCMNAMLSQRDAVVAVVEASRRQHPGWCSCDAVICTPAFPPVGVLPGSHRHT